MNKKYKNNEPWTPEENQVLRDYYYELSREVLFNILPGRSINDIVQQVAKLERAGEIFRGSTK